MSTREAGAGEATRQQILSSPQGAKIVKKKDIESREEIEVRD